jgi:hypothetical protein
MKALILIYMQIVITVMTVMIAVGDVQLPGSVKLRMMPV